jgi:hypothetical protein
MAPAEHWSWSRILLRGARRGAYVALAPAVVVGGIWAAVLARTPGALLGTLGWYGTLAAAAVLVCAAAGALTAAVAALVVRPWRAGARDT